MDAFINPNNILLVLSELDDKDAIKDFCGTVIHQYESSSLPDPLSGKTVYLCGDLRVAKGVDLKTAARVFVIEELSYRRDGNIGLENWQLVKVGRVPILVHKMGVLYSQFFDSACDYYKRIHSEHTLQSLFESTKPTKAHRTGIYLTPVERQGTELHFRLLRCSTNLSGPSDNFRATDHHIVDALNEEVGYIFQHAAPLNHVLAQNYANVPASEGQKQAKAKISAHADKTKDMPDNAIMAFCTFYDGLDKLKPIGESYDYGHKNISGLTRLRFRLKENAAKFHRGSLPAQFTVTLYPNSVFFMPISTNRLYTHEVQASELDVSMLPTRLGYVVRCSSTEAVHDGKNTFLKVGSKRLQLQAPAVEGMKELRDLYAHENSSMDRVHYGGRFLFSMNGGDYMAPGYKDEDNFRVYDLSGSDKWFAQLEAATRFEEVGKGRQGGVLVKPSELGTPIVRTTSKYTAPAQIFNPVHQRLSNEIRKCASLPLELNNALIEMYDNAYTTMGYHSDQALDLEDDSYVAVFSCYELPHLVKTPRTLVVESKETGRTFQIPMKHNSLIVFSTSTNRRYKHKIVLDALSGNPENTWLGVTFRTSKTFVQSRDGQPLFSDGTPLKLANDEESRDFYRQRGSENRQTDFRYPPISYTISNSDLVPPEAVAVRGA